MSNAQDAIKSGPVKYTSYEGGFWQKWEGGDLEPGWSFRRNTSTRIVDVGSEMVHSLLFEDGTRWDCINGWN